MHPHRQLWHYGGYAPPATAYPADPAAAYASYYSQMYGATGVPAAPTTAAPPAHHYQPAAYSDGAPAYSSDFSSGNSGFTVPPPMPRSNSHKYRQTSNLYEIPSTSQPPLPTSTPLQRPAITPEVKPSPSSWQDIKQTSASPASAPTPGSSTAAKLPARIFPMKRFVKSQEGMSPEELEEGPTCHRITDLAAFNKVKMSYEKIEDQVSPGVFGVRLKLGTEVYTGTGSSYKLAKECAAGKALLTTSYTKPTYKSTMKTRPMGVTATQELFELATKKGVSPEFIFIQPPNFEFKPAMRQWTKDEMRSHYKVKLVILGQEFFGEADLPQQAKHNAAVQALPLLNSLPDLQQQIKAAAAAASGSGSLEDVPVDSTMTDAATLGTLPNGKNVIMTLNEIAMHQSISIDWNMVGEFGPPHKRSYVWSMKFGDYEAKGSGLSKKVAKTVAAINIYETIPIEWKEASAATMASKKKRKNNKRKATDAALQPVAATPAKIPAVQVTPAAKLPQPVAPEIPKTPIHQAIQANHPISALFEYCKKVKHPDPDFEVISENVIESWPKDNRTFKKIEYTMRLNVAGQTFFASANTKKAAKTAVATEAWNIIRTGTM